MKKGATNMGDMKVTHKYDIRISQNLIKKLLSQHKIHVTDKMNFVFSSSVQIFLEKQPLSI